MRLFVPEYKKLLDRTMDQTCTIMMLIWECRGLNLRHDREWLLACANGSFSPAKFLLDEDYSQQPSMTECYKLAIKSTAKLGAPMHKNTPTSGGFCCAMHFSRDCNYRSTTAPCVGMSGIRKGSVTPLNAIQGASAFQNNARRWAGSDAVFTVARTIVDRISILRYRHSEWPSNQLPSTWRIRCQDRQRGNLAARRTTKYPAFIINRSHCMIRRRLLHDEHASTSLRTPQQSLVGLKDGDVGNRITDSLLSKEPAGWTTISTVVSTSAVRLNSWRVE